MKPLAPSSMPACASSLSFLNSDFCVGVKVLPDKSSPPSALVPPSSFASSDRTRFSTSSGRTKVPSFSFLKASMPQTIWSAFHCSCGAPGLPSWEQVHHGEPFSHVESIGVSHTMLPLRMSMTKLSSNTQRLWAHSAAALASVRLIVRPGRPN
jgi:hypothetical protein